MHILRPIALLLLVSLAQAGELKPQHHATPRNTFVWDEGEFRPQAGNAYQTWYFDGEVLRPKTKLSPRYQYNWNGDELDPGPALENHTIIKWDGEELEGTTPAGERMTWRKKEDRWEARHTGAETRYWLVDDDVPVPLAAMVLFDRMDLRDARE